MKDFPLYRSGRSAIIGTLILAVPLLLLASTPLLGLYAVLIVLFLLPVALCMASLMCGLLPMVIGAAAGLISMHMLLGMNGLTLSALYLLPILLAFLLVILRRVPFWKGCAVMIGVHLATLAAVYAVLQQWTGGALYAAAGAAAAQALENWELGDTMLYQFYAMGLIGLPESLAEGALRPVAGGYTLSSAARADLLLSVRTLVETALTTLIPNIIVSQSILGGVLSLLLPLRFGFIAAEKRAFLSESDDQYMTDETGKKKVAFPDLGMPPFSLWHVPRGIGWQVGAALILGYFLRVSATPALSVAGVILYSAASAVFIIQGAALINFTQKSRGTRRVWRVVVPVLLAAFSVLSLIGIFDQIVNIRGLRKPREPKEGL